MAVDNKRKLEANWFGNQSALGELKIADFSRKSYDYFRQTDMFKKENEEDRISWETWERYWTDEKIFSILGKLNESYVGVDGAVYINPNYEPIKKEEDKKTVFDIFTIEGQVKQFYEIQPFFYDKTKLFHRWDIENKKWELCDIEDMLNGIRKEVPGTNTINSKNKAEITNGLKQIGREKKPDPLPVSCIQFKDKIVNAKTGEEFEATPKWFTTNPIPWKLGDSTETPTIDNLLKEWVVDNVTQDETYVKTMKEIIAHSTTSHQFLQRIIALCGGGMNGKGTFIKLIDKFIGKENSCVSDLRILADNRFETSSLYKKLVCMMGEVNAEDLKSTNTIKKLSGEDDMRYEFKGKGSFTEESPTTCIIATNSLPTTPDKSVGFYRRWLTIDFPHQFELKEGLIDSIPGVEFENLGKCILELLKELYKTNKFTNEGSIEERRDRYEERSNPILKFIEEYCEEECGKVELKDFSNAFNDYLRAKHLRVVSPKGVGTLLKTEGFEISARTVYRDNRQTSARCVINLRLKTTLTTQTTNSIL